MTKLMTGMLLGIGTVFAFSGTTGRIAKAEPADSKSEIKSTRIALIDMAKVFKTSRLFEKKREELKLQISEAEEVAKSMQAALVQMKKKFDGLEKGAEDRADLERQMKSKAAEFEEYRKGESSRFLKAESKIYLEVYELTTAEVSNYARKHNIDLVIRFASDPIKDEDPQKLLQSMNRQVVYDNGLDITDEIIAAMQ